MIGLDVVRAWSPHYPNQCALIGGAAGRLMMNHAGVATEKAGDVPVALSLRVVSEDFAIRVEDLVRAGRYRNGRASVPASGLVQFIEPEAPHFPPLLEVLDRSATVSLEADRTPSEHPNDMSTGAVPAGPLMDEPTFAVLGTRLAAEDSPPILDERDLIPVKARAWMDLADRRLAGHAMDRDAVRKPLREVFQLLALVPRSEPIHVPVTAQDDLVDFIVRQHCNPGIDLQAEGFAFSLPEALHLLSELYGLDITG